MKKALLSVKSLSISFAGTQVVQNVSFDLFEGESVGLVGASGSGKSVTAQAILLPVGTVDEGQILFQDSDLLQKSQCEMQKIRGKKIGMIFQDPLTALNPLMTIGNQLMEGLRTHEQVTRQEARHKVLEWLHLVGISDPAMRFSQYPFELSGGMRQRVMIAMAMVCEPLLLIADEPTTALDVTVQAQILELIKTIKALKKLSVLFITHDLGLVAGLCERVLVMQGGRIVESGTVDEIFYSPKHPYSQQLLRKSACPI